MAEKFFIVEIQRKNGVWSKGIVVADTQDAARQGFHAYLGAYAYGHDETVDYVQSAVLDIDGRVTDSCVWNNMQEV